jgi:hypothetical protein
MSPAGCSCGRSSTPTTSTTSPYSGNPRTRLSTSAAAAVATGGKGVRALRCGIKPPAELAQQVQRGGGRGRQLRGRRAAARAALAAGRERVDERAHEHSDLHNGFAARNCFQGSCQGSCYKPQNGTTVTNSWMRGHYCRS